MWKCWLKSLLVCIKEVRREVKHWESADICKTWGRLWHGLGLQIGMLVILSRLINLWTKKSTIGLWSMVQYNLESIWLATASYFSMKVKHCQCSKSIPEYQNLDLNIIETAWDHLTDNRTKGSQHPKENFECPSRSLETYSWRLLKEMTTNLN